MNTQQAIRTAHSAALQNAQGHAHGESKNPGTVTIKKLCGGLAITLGEFSPPRNLTGWNRR